MNKPAEDTILEYLTLLKNFLDEENRLKAFPSKRKLQLCAVSYLVNRDQSIYSLQSRYGLHDV